MDLFLNVRCAWSFGHVFLTHICFVGTYLPAADALQHANVTTVCFPRTRIWRCYVDASVGGSDAARPRCPQPRQSFDKCLVVQFSVEWDMTLWLAVSDTHQAHPMCASLNCSHGGAACAQCFHASAASAVTMWNPFWHVNDVVQISQYTGLALAWEH